jgi:hypothetical protein
LGLEGKSAAYTLPCGIATSFLSAQLDLDQTCGALKLEKPRLNHHFLPQAKA